jgi:hypothetical protein
MERKVVGKVDGESLLGVVSIVVLIEEIAPDRIGIN